MKTGSILRSRKEVPMPKKMTEEQKKKIADGQRARWAAKKSKPVPDPVEVRARISRPIAPPAPPPPDPTVIAFRQQLVPLVEKRENIQQHVRQSQRVLQDAQIALQNDQQALQDTEAQIQYRLNMIAQLTGQPQQAPMMVHVSEVAMYPSGEGFASALASPGPRIVADQSRYYQAPVNTYNGPEVNLMGNPNIPAGVTSIPAPQNMRYASGYVPTGPDNPRSESAVDVRSDPATAEMARAIVEQRKAQATI